MKMTNNRTAKNAKVVRQYWCQVYRSDAIPGLTESARRDRKWCMTVVKQGLQPSVFSQFSLQSMSLALLSRRDSKSLKTKPETESSILIS